MKSSKILGMALFLVVATLSLLAQTTNGRILGTVHDQSGAAVANATVTVTDAQRGATRKLTTDGSGNFVASALPPSVYTVRAEANGFKTVEHQNVQLEVAQNVSLDFSLVPRRSATTSGRDQRSTDGEHVQCDFGRNAQQRGDQ